MRSRPLANCPTNIFADDTKAPHDPEEFIDPERSRTIMTTTSRRAALPVAPIFVVVKPSQRMKNVFTCVVAVTVTLRALGLLGSSNTTTLPGPITVLNVPNEPAGKVAVNQITPLFWVAVGCPAG